MRTISNSKYLENPNVCPSRSSNNLDGDSFQADDNCAWQSLWCVDCGLSWTDEYILNGLGNVYDDATGEDIQVVE